MIYAAHDDSAGIATVVGSADTAIELDTFANQIVFDVGGDDAFATRVWRPTSEQMTHDHRFAGFVLAPVVVEHASAEQRELFGEWVEMQVVTLDELRERAAAMMQAAREAVEQAQGEDDERPIGEILGLMEHDPWDRRSPEEIEQDRLFKEQAEAAKKAGKLTSDSFEPPPEKRGYSAVRRIDVQQQDDGSYAVTGALIEHKNADDEETIDEDAVASVRVPASTMTEVRRALNSLALFPLVAVGMDYEEVMNIPLADAARVALYLHESGVACEFASGENDFAPLDLPEIQKLAGIIPDFDSPTIPHRVDAQAHDLETVTAILRRDAPSLAGIVLTRGQSGGCGWLACRSRGDAERVALVLRRSAEIGPAGVEVYAVNRFSERLVPKGVETVDQTSVAAIGPRPWNERADELVAMSEEERTAALRKIKGREMIYSGSYLGPQGTVVRITPASYFNETGELWPDPLPLSHLLPSELTEIAPGLYRTFSYDWNTLTTVLSGLHMRESMPLQMYLNRAE